MSSTAIPDGAPPPATMGELLAENRRLRTRLAALQTGSEDHTARLASLYVAVNSLHCALDQQAVLTSVRDIVTTFIGSEELAIFEADPAEGRLRLLASEGIEPGRYEGVRLGDGPIGTTAVTGEPLIRPAGGSVGLVGDEALTACIPLKLGERVLGVLAIFRLLPQKGQLDTSDLDLFDALTAHVAHALVFTRLYAGPGRAVGASM